VCVLLCVARGSLFTQCVRSQNSSLTAKLIAERVARSEEKERREEVEGVLEGVLRKRESVVSVEELEAVKREVEALKEERERRGGVEREVRAMLEDSERRCGEMERKWVAEHESVEEELGKLRVWNETVRGNVEVLERRCEEFKGENGRLMEERQGFMKRIDEMETAVGEKGEVLLARIRDGSAPQPEQHPSSVPFSQPSSVPANQPVLEPLLEPMLDLDDSSSQLDSDDDVKSIEWIASTVSTPQKVMPNSEVLKFMSGSCERARVHIEEPSTSKCVVKKASPKKASPKRSSPKRGSPKRSSSTPARSSPTTKTKTQPLLGSPPVPPRPKRKEEKSFGEALEEIDKKECFDDVMATPPLPYIMATVVKTSREQQYEHLVVTSELQEMHRRENTPERKGKRKIIKKIANKEGGRGGRRK